nr:unnamed protein product [Callosobruchus chinensis]
MSQTSSLLSTHQWIKGVVIPFITPPRQTSIKDTIIPKNELRAYDQALEELIELGERQSVNMSLKPNGKSRFILNLKELNKFIHAPHFKLRVEDYRSLLKLLSHNSYLGNIDMKDAYYMIAVNDNYEKYQISL